MSGQTVAIPCNCEAQNAPPNTDERDEHTNECTFRPMCLDVSCHNYGKPVNIANDGLYACLDLYDGFKSEIE